MIDASDQDHEGSAPSSRPANPGAGSAPLLPWQVLALEQYRELNTNFRSLWDIYIKFYTVFLTANVLGLGIVIDRVDPGNRPLIVAAFVAQNLLAAGTAAGLARHARVCGERLRATASSLLPGPGGEAGGEHPLVTPPIPDTLSAWAGAANVLSHFLLIALWLAVLAM